MNSSLQRLSGGRRIEMGRKDFAAAYFCYEFSAVKGSRESGASWNLNLFCMVFIIH